MMYKIFGDYGYTSETLLEEFKQLNEAIAWVISYSEYGDLGGYDRIEVCTFLADGEVVVHFEVETDPTCDFLHMEDELLQDEA